jgi:predicted CXXCH cytochrome family protein
MASMKHVLIVAIGVGVLGAVGAAQPAGPRADGYAWAGSCGTCHDQIYEAWAKTKHAAALNRLSNADQEKVCIGCHVTGPKSRVTEGKTVLNAGVQCESCHGAGAAHAANPEVKVGLTKSPGEAVCVECHSDKGPHFKGFFFSAMKGLCHKVG